MKDQRYIRLSRLENTIFWIKEAKRGFVRFIETLLKRIITVAWFFNALEKFDWRHWTLAAPSHEVSTFQQPRKLSRPIDHFSLSF